MVAVLLGKEGVEDRGGVSWVWCWVEQCVCVKVNKCVLLDVFTRLGGVVDPEE